DVVDLLLRGARFATSRAAAEARTAGADRPRRGSHREASDLADDRLDVDAVVGEALRHCDQIALMPGQQVPLDVEDLIGGDAKGHLGPPGGQRRNAVAMPPSTGTNRPVVRDRPPAVSATTASATWVGKTSLPRSVRP